MPLCFVASSLGIYLDPKNLLNINQLNYFGVIIKVLLISFTWKIEMPKFTINFLVLSEIYSKLLVKIIIIF